MKPNNIDQAILKKAFTLLCTAKSITEVFEEQFKVVSKYVHATSRGHEALQIAVGMQLTPKDYMSPYYRDDAMMLSIGMSPYDLMLQVLAKKNDPFSGGRSYYCHPSLKDDDKPKIPHQSSATGMQVIPATGVAMGIQYKEKLGLNTELGAIVVCSLGDASVREGEISEAIQMAALKQFPILYLVQDNGWDISATAAETRALNAFQYAKGFPGIEAVSIDGSEFTACYQTLENIIHTMRTERRPFLVHAKVPLLNHHTSGVRKEWYRDDIEEHKKNDPYDKLLLLVKESGISEGIINDIIQEAQNNVRNDLNNALKADDPQPSDLFTNDFAPTHVTAESGDRSPSHTEFLRGEGIHALAYHAGLDASVRAHHQTRFLREDGVVMVATIAFGMGIVKPDVRFVAHLDLPKSMEGYYQETGRAGGDGDPAEAWMVYGLGDVVLLRQMIDGSEAGDERKRLERSKLDALLAYCKSVRCRRQTLLDYFAEDYPQP